MIKEYKKITNEEKEMISHEYEIDVIIDNGKNKRKDAVLFFGTIENKLVAPVYHCKAKNMESLMVELDIYKSKSKAKRAGRKGKIPEGFTERYKASKIKWLSILNPI